MLAHLIVAITSRVCCEF